MDSNTCRFFGVWSFPGDSLSLLSSVPKYNSAGFMTSYPNTCYLAIYNSV